MFGAHALKQKLPPEMLQVFEVGVRYQMYHAFALFVVAWGAAFMEHPWRSSLRLVVYHRYRSFLRKSLCSCPQRYKVAGRHHAIGRAFLLDWLVMARMECLEKYSIILEFNNSSYYPITYIRRIAMRKTRILLVAAAALAAIVVVGVMNAQQKIRRLSPAASVSQTVGLTDITVTYHRPGVKGRKIWGGLVPYDKVWRAGERSNNSDF